MFSFRSVVFCFGGIGILFPLYRRDFRRVRGAILFLPFGVLMIVLRVFAFVLLCLVLAHGIFARFFLAVRCVLRCCRCFCCLWLGRQAFQAF